jgi:hypothetical protein
MANTGRTLRVRSIDGNTENQAKLIISNLKLIITTEITGYTCQYIYGDTSHDLNYESIVVPTYKLNVEKDGKIIASYNVTRDSWYCRGVLTNNWGWDDDDIELANRCFEPADGNINLYSTVGTAYPPGAGVDALALRQNKSEELAAVPHTKRMQTVVNGHPIDDARKNLSIATGVMIHIGGWYNKGSKNKLGGSYGCFGLIPSAQINKTKVEAEKVRTGKSYKDYEPSNKPYKAAFEYITKHAGGKNIHVIIQKRSNVEQLRTLKNQ